MQAGGTMSMTPNKDWLFKVWENDEKRVNWTRVPPILRLGDSVESPYVGFGFVPPVMGMVGQGNVQGLHRKFRKSLEERGLGGHMRNCVADADCDAGMRCRDFLFGKFCVVGTKEREWEADPVPVPIPVRYPEDRYRPRAEDLFI